MPHSDFSDCLLKEFNMIPALGRAKIFAFSVSNVKDASGTGL